MHWPWKWFELYNNCTFSTWKDNCLFNLLFCIPNSVCTFHYYGGRHSLPCLPWRHVIDFLLFRILSNLRLPWRKGLSWNFSLYWNIFYLSGFLSNLCLPWKTECLNALYWIYIFYHSEFWITCACPEKQSLPWSFLLYWIYFLQSGFLSNLHLPWKTECALNTLYWNIFYHSEFWTICACPEKQFALKFFTVLKYFLSLGIFQQRVLAPKREFALKFFTVLKYFLSFRIFQQVVLALKTEFALNFSSRGRGFRPPPPRTPLCTVIWNI